ncbi:MAG: CARDB domain-containing protein, partial [Longimicrobiales bacterium]
VEVAPSIASATPMTLAIRVGGPTQTVTFTGSRLNIITDAYVERSSGQRVNGVRVELQSSTDARRRDIRFTALANAGPPWGDALRLVLEYRVGVMPMSLRPALQITAAAPANVDLSVSSCTFQTTRSAPGTRVQVVATIQNMGSAGLSFQTGQLIARVVPHFQQFSASLPVPGQPAPPAPAPFQTFPAEGGGRYIAPGGTASVTASFNAISTATSYEVTWTVDPDDVVPESNANNNERRCAYTPPPPVTPDLQISGIATQPQSGPPQTTFVFTVTVSGAGIQRYSPYAILDVRCLIDGAAFTGGSFAVPNSVRQHPNAASGSISYTHEIRTTRSFAVGSHVLECIVDPEQALNPAEATRANNARSLLFNVTSN